MLPCKKGKKLPSLDLWLEKSPQGSTSSSKENLSAGVSNEKNDIPLEVQHLPFINRMLSRADNCVVENHGVLKAGKNNPQDSTLSSDTNETDDLSLDQNEIPSKAQQPAKNLQTNPKAKRAVRKHRLYKTCNNRRYYFQDEWLKTYKWARLDSRDKILCDVCIEAKKFGMFPTDFYVRENIGYDNWKSGEEGLKIHQDSEQHRKADVKTFCAKTPAAKLTTQVRKLQSSAQVALRAIVTSLQYLGMQGLAIQGHTNDDGNFKRLLSLRSNDIPELEDWLKRNRKFTSVDIQNEILKYMGLEIQRKIIQEIQQCNEYSIIADESSDISGKEQLAFCIRTVNADLTPKEFFLGLYEVKSTTSESIFTVIRDILQRFGLDIHKIRSQCYDGASNMSGIHRGVAAQVAEVEPRAIYVHCYAHCLNLAVQDSVKSLQKLRNTMETVHELAVVVKGSPKRIAQFQDLCSNNEGNSKLKPQPLCPTRFLLRVRSFRAVKENYGILMELMEELGETNEKVAPKACGILNQLSKFETYFTIVLSIQLFSYVESLSRAVQKPSASLSGILETVHETCLVLNQHSTDISMFEALWNEAEEASSAYGLEPPCVPRKRKVPQKYHGTIPSTNHYSSPKDMLLRLYQETYSKACNEIQCRFNQKGIQSYIEMERVILRSLDTGVSDEKAAIKSLCEKYELSEERLQVNLQTLKYSEFKFENIRAIVNYIQGLAVETKVLYSELSKLLKILLLFPVSSCTAERGFSVMKYVKSYPRSTMGQARLNHCCLLHAYPAEVELLDIDSIMRLFINNETRVKIFGSL